MKDTIFISIVSYRDKDLEKTVKSCFYNAKDKGRILFSIISQAEDNEHPDLSFIPDDQLEYAKFHWSESSGVCWARSLAMKNVRGRYFLQIDSHSRFKNNWDDLIINNFNKSSTFWGERIIITGYPEEFEVDDSGKERLLDSDSLNKLEPIWDVETKMIQARHPWPEVVDRDYGDEIFFLSANSLFTTVDVIKEIPYDKDIYFTGEEASMAIRAYTRGIRLISPASKYMYTHYNRSAYKRQFHWQDHPQWWMTNSDSYAKLYKIMSGKDGLGDYGIGSRLLFDQYQKITGIDLTSLYA